MNVGRMRLDAEESVQLHASCVAMSGKGVVLLGRSGSGKSDLALRLIDTGAELVGDDQIVFTQTDSALLASPADNIEGLLEARGIGILQLPYLTNVPVWLAVKLVIPNAVERMPEPEFFDCLDKKVPLLLLNAFEHSTPAKIRIFLASL